MIFVIYLAQRRALGGEAGIAILVAHRRPHGRIAQTADQHVADVGQHQDHRRGDRGSEQVSNRLKVVDESQTDAGRRVILI